MATKSNTGNIEEFNRWARTYESSWRQTLLFDRVHGVVLDLVASECGQVEPESFLDVGCGTGRLLRKVGARWPAAQLTGVDAAEAMIEVARRLTPAATFHVGAAESMPLPEASVDVVLSTMSFHHWDDWAAGVHDVARVLRPGGRFFLADILIPAGLLNLLRRLSPKHPHFRPISPAMLQGFMDQAGLHVQLQRRALGPFFVFVTVGMKS